MEDAYMVMKKFLNSVKEKTTYGSDSNQTRRNKE